MLTLLRCFLYSVPGSTLISSFSPHILTIRKTGDLKGNPPIFFSNVKISTIARSHGSNQRFESGNIFFPRNFNIIDIILNEIDSKTQSIHQHGQAGLADMLVMVLLKNLPDQLHAVCLGGLQRNHGVAVHIFRPSFGLIKLNIFIHGMANGGTAHLGAGQQQFGNGLRADQATLACACT